MTNIIEQRQLEFKVWDEALGMPEPFKLGEHRAVFHRESGRLINKNIDLSMRFLQFTGLKDCDGNEIYEGDIIKRLKDLSCFLIRYSVGRFCASSRFIDGDGFRCHSHDYKIVGNIYENHELLEIREIN